MSKIVLSRPIFDVLVKHLVDIEEEKDRIMGEYYPNVTDERDKFKQLISTYINEIEEYLSNSKVKDNISRDFPFVTIGSIVEIEDLTYKETEKLTIVSPFINKASMNLNCASYLSPMGKTLLLKKVEDRVVIETPAGKSTYIIKSIELPI
jgi:transcription elongation factor GreA